MSKVFPYSGKSALENARATCSKQSFWLKLSGYSCLPCFCIGMSCLMVDQAVAPFKKKYDMIIEFYGGINKVRELSQKIANELRIFRDARAVANDQICAHFIVSTVSILDIIFCAHPKIKSIIRPNPLDIFNMLTEIEKNKYFMTIWEEYVKRGGNYHVIVYGIIEYMCGVYDPTCPLMESSINSLLSETAYRAECVAHRAEGIA